MLLAGSFNELFFFSVLTDWEVELVNEYVDLLSFGFVDVFAFFLYLDLFFCALYAVAVNTPAADKYIIFSSLLFSFFFCLFDLIEPLNSA